MSVTISITKDNKSVDIDIPTEWKDVTVKYWAEMASIISSHQKSLEDETKGHLEENEAKPDVNITAILNDAEIVDTLKLNRDIFCYISGLSKEDMKEVDMNQVATVIETLGVLMKEYEPKGLRFFEFEGETYYFPSEYLKKNTYGDFIESTQLDMNIEQMKNGRYDVLPAQMAILCRREGEEYDEDLLEAKTEKFQNLPMDTVYEFAFFLTNAAEKLVKVSNIYLEKKDKA